MSFLAGRNRSRKFCQKSVQNLMSLEYCKVASSHKKMEWKKSVQNLMSLEYCKVASSHKKMEWGPLCLIRLVS